MFDALLMSFLNGLPNLLIHYGTTMAILAAGIAIYVRVTPYPEIKLVKEGNMAAAISLSGGILGIAIPLAAAMSPSVHPVEILMWGAVALLVTLTVYWIADHLFKEIPKRIEEGDCAAALVMSAIKLATAIILAPAVAG